MISQRKKDLFSWFATSLGAVLLCCLMAAWILSVGVSSACAETVVVVLSSDARPYREAQWAITSQLSRPGRVILVKLIDKLAEDGSEMKLPEGVGAVIAVGTRAATELHGRLPASIPLTYCMVTDPERLGLLKGRVTLGVTTSVSMVDQIHVMTSALPRARVIGVLYNSVVGGQVEMLKAFGESLPEGMSLNAVDVSRYGGVAEAIGKLIEGSDVIWTFPDGSLYTTTTVRSLLLSALRGGVPVFGFSTPFVKAGALIGVGINPRDQGVQASEIMAGWLSGDSRIKDMMAKGSRVTAPRYMTAVNLIVAKRLSLEVEAGFVQEADFVVKSE